MRWFALVVAVMVAGTVVWAMFFRGSPAGTPFATAEAYVAAALKNDPAKIGELCAPEAAKSAEEVAAQIRAVTSDPLVFQFQRMKADPPRVGLMAMFAGRLLGLELIQQGKLWKIVQVGLSLL